LDRQYGCSPLGAWSVLIHQETSPSQWYHVPGVENPADLATRGCSLQDIIRPSVWVDGPSFLYGGSDVWSGKTGVPSDSMSNVQ
jgi:hypothetical protein